MDFRSGKQVLARVDFLVSRSDTDRAVTLTGRDKMMKGIRSESNRKGR